MARKYCRWNVNVATNSRRLRRYFNDSSESSTHKHKHSHFLSHIFCVYWWSLITCLPKCIELSTSIPIWNLSILLHICFFCCCFLHWLRVLRVVACSMFECKWFGVGMLSWNDCFSYTPNILCEMLISINIMCIEHCWFGAEAAAAAASSISHGKSMANINSESMLSVCRKLWEYGFAMCEHFRVSSYPKIDRQFKLKWM